MILNGHNFGSNQNINKVLTAFYSEMAEIQDRTNNSKCCMTEM